MKIEDMRKAEEQKQSVIDILENGNVKSFVFYAFIDENNDPDEDGDVILSTHKHGFTESITEMIGLCEVMKYELLESMLHNEKLK